jgi:DNA-binding beta-propeller fold protein YncE
VDNTVTFRPSASVPEPRHRWLRWLQGTHSVMSRRCCDWMRLWPAVVALCALALINPPAFAASQTLYVSTVTVGAPNDFATDVLFDGQFIWAAVEGSKGGSIEKLSLSGEFILSTPVGQDPVEMVFDGTNIWVTNYDSSSLTVVSEEGAIVKTLFLPLSYKPEGILFDGKYIWTANNGYGVNTVSKIDAATIKLVASYPVGNGPDGLAFDGTYIWVTNSYGDNVMKLDRDTGEILRTYPTGAYPLSIVFDGKDMWVGNGAVDSGYPPLVAASVTELRAAGGVNLGTFAAGNRVRGLALDATSIWTCNSLANTFTRIRLADGAELGTYPTGQAPRGIAYDGLRMWIANSAENTVTVVSPQAEPTLLTPGFRNYFPRIELPPKILVPVASSVPLSDAGDIPNKPQFSPSTAALGGILGQLLNN